MRRFWRSWAGTILFWVFFLGSIALNGRYPLLDKMWLTGGFGALAILSTSHLIRVSRKIGRDQGNVSYRGIPIYRGAPAWLREILGADESRLGNPRA